MEPIPNVVLDAMERVRQTGEVNMYDSTGVIQRFMWPEEREATVWLIDNPARYVEALVALGKRNVD